MGRHAEKPRPRNLQPSIYFRPRKDGSGAYHFYFIDPETKRQRSIMVADVPPGMEKDPEVIATANSEANKQKEALRSKKAPARPADITVPQAWAEMLKRKDLKTSTLDDYASIWRNYLEPRFGKLKVRELDEKRVLAFVDWLDAQVFPGTREEMAEANASIRQANAAIRKANRKLAKQGKRLRTQKRVWISQKRRNNILIAAKSLLSWCLAQRYIVEDLGRLLRPGKYVKRSFRIASYEETAKLLKVIDPFWAPFVETALYTGARAGELVAADWEDADFHTKKLSIHRSYTHGAMSNSTKSGDARTVPLPDRVIDTLKKWKKRCPSETIMFPSPTGNRMSIDTFRQRIWKPAVEAIGRPDLRIHDLRHTYITWVVAASGATAFGIAQVSGHKQLSSVQFYIDNYSAEQERIRSVFNKSKEQMELERNGLSYEQLIGSASSSEADAPKQAAPKKTPKAKGSGIVIKRKKP